MSEHTHPGDGTVPGPGGEPILTPAFGCLACAEQMERHGISVGGEHPRVHPGDPRPDTDGPVLWDSAAPRRPGDLAGFLLARIAEDEEAVNDRTRHLAPGGWSYEEQFGDFGDDERWMIEIPASRVLAECEAKRRIVSQYRLYDAYAQQHRRPEDERERMNRYAMTIWDALRALALPYADHQDYREEWKP